jgi:RNA polymerase sigma-70 factor, ECF subfamily
MLVVLDRLAPAERVAFVLHDMFDLPFDEIAPLIERSAEATRQLASRARRRVHGVNERASESAKRHRTLAEAFLKAAREGDLTSLLQLLDPDIVLKVDSAAARLGPGGDVRGADAVATFFNGRADAGHVAVIDGEVGIVVVPNGVLLLVLRATFKGDRIAGLEAIATPEELRKLRISMPWPA